ncbi:MAG: hypothetical protein HY894_07865 [Deltaproteobacteria bacterium]|nr:hypothetical protein [Deltaproteobacteria bacterium]
MRWKTLRPHAEQARLWTENKRFAVVPAGRRSGKTELAKRRLVVSLPVKKEWADPRYFAAAPTRDQAKRIFWRDLKALVPAAWVRRVYEGDLCIATRFGSELWVVGLDRPERIEGVAWDGGVLDEYANMRGEAWTQHIRPALSDRRGWCWIIGVPEGLNHYKDLVDYARGGADPDWGAYAWPSADIVDAAEVEAARRVLDARTFRQEYEGSFEGATGRVYYPYDAARHEDAGLSVAPGLPIILCCDFNVDPCVWEAAQTDGKQVWVVDEIMLCGTSTAEMGKAALGRFGGHPGGVVVYGDAAGLARSTAGASDYAILQELGFRNQRVRKANPHVKDRVNAVNAMLENIRGEVRLRHRPECRSLRKDFEAVAWAEAGGEIDKRDRARTHASDALGYFVEHEFGLRLGRPDPAKRFYK